MLPVPCDEPTLPPELSDICLRLAPLLNVVGVADGTRFAHLIPDCASVLVFASGGTALWHAFMEDARTVPDRFANEVHPLDSFVARLIEDADPHPGPSRRWVRAAATESVMIDFRTLAVDAGIGWPSRLGLVLHPEFGPWIGLRAACFTVAPLAGTGPLPGGGPCTNCDAPCVAACPAGAVSDEPSQAWNVERCASYNLSSSNCRAGCHSRIACPVGARHRYPPDALAYHYHRQSGRAAICERLDIQDRAHGYGPDWESWGPAT